MTNQVLRRSNITRLLTAVLLAHLTAAITFSQTLTFAVVGDTGDVGDKQRAIAAQMNNYRNTKRKFEFVLLLGDNVYSYWWKPRSLKQAFEEPFKALLDSGVKFYAVLGNHDIGEDENQINYPNFNMGGRHFYSLKMNDGLVEFFALDSTALSEEAEKLVAANLLKLEKTKAATEKSLESLQPARTKPSVRAAMQRQEAKLEQVDSQIEKSQNFLQEIRTAKSEQLPWLDESLAKSNGRWKIVFLHHAIFSSAAAHGKDPPVLALRAMLKDKLMVNKVDVVFAGHDHVFEKVRPQSTKEHTVNYMTVGAGSKLRKGDLDKKNSFFEFGEDRKPSFVVVRLSANRMDVEVIGAQGENIFTFCIPKQGLKCEVVPVD